MKNRILDVIGESVLRIVGVMVVMVYYLPAGIALSIMMIIEYLFTGKIKISGKMADFVIQSKKRTDAIFSFTDDKSN